MTNKEIAEKKKWSADRLEEIRVKIRNQSYDFKSYDIQALNWAITFLRGER